MTSRHLRSRAAALRAQLRHRFYRVALTAESVAPVRCASRAFQSSLFPLQTNFHRFNPPPHSCHAQDYKRRDELQGGPGVAKYSTVTTDPGLDVEPTEKPEHNNSSSNGAASDAPRRSSSSSSSGRGAAISAAAERDPLPTFVDKAGGEAGSYGLIGDGDDREAGGVGGRGGGGGEREGGRKTCPGKVPLDERPQKHRKYYKV